MSCRMNMLINAKNVHCHQLHKPSAPTFSLNHLSSLNDRLVCYQKCNQQSTKYNLLKFSFLDWGRSISRRRRRRRIRRRGSAIVASSSSNAAASFWDNWVPEKSPKSPSISDILWPSAGAFAAMAILGKIDQILEPRGIAMTIAPFGAVCAVLFATPSAPGARKYNMFLAQMGCALIGVLAFSIFGPGWLARSSALAAATAFMIYSGAIHPPAASLPLLFIDGAKLHHLNFWYILFPGATGCIVLCLIQEIVCYLKDNCRF